MKINDPRETDEQQALIKWAQYHPICSKYLIANPLGGYRLPREAARLKREGSKKGVSDLFLAYPSNGCHGLWIEMKRKGKFRITPEQSEWLELMIGVGYSARIAIGWEDAVRIIKEYLNHEKHTIFND